MYMYILSASCDMFLSELKVGGPPFLNPLSPDIKMHILLTVLHTFLMEPVRRICLNIKTSYPW